jgi:hypothetical protein
VFRKELTSLRSEKKKFAKQEVVLQKYGEKKIGFQKKEKDM